MSGVSEAERSVPAPVQVRKGRGQWSYWVGTPSVLADLANRAMQLVHEEGAETILKATATAPAFDATFATPEQIRAGLRPDDLKELRTLSIEVDQDLRGDVRRRIEITLVRQQPAQSSSQKSQAAPAVKLSVAGPDRDWVDLATLRMKEAIQKGTRPTNKIRGALAIVGLGLIGFAIFISEWLGDETAGLNAAEIVAVGLLITGLIPLLFAISLDAVTPQLELLPDGALTRWQRLTGRLDVSGRWVLDAVVKGAVGAAIAILIDRLI